MRILMTADTVGGVWTYCMDLARALEPHGVQVDLATMGATPTRQQRDEVAARPNVRLHDSRYKLEWMDDPWQDVARAGVWLLQLEELTRPDIVHLNGYVHGCLPWRAPCIVVGHSCVLSWWQAVKHESAPASWEHYAQEVRRGLQAADRVVAPTQAMLDQLHLHYGPLPPSQVILNGRAAAMFRPAAKQPYIFAAGRLWDDAKNIATLATAAPHVAWRVCVAGDDRHPDGRQSRLDGVQMLDRLAPWDIAKQLAAASIYALPARYEPFGLSALEAALAGCALVLGDIPSLREVWGDAAIFVPPDDADALAWQLNRLISNASLRSDLAQRASIRARRYRPARMAAGYRVAYQDLVAAGQHR